MMNLVNLPAAFDIGTLLQNSFLTAKSWGGWIMLIVGVVMIVVCVYMTAKGLMSHGQSQTSWPKVILLLIFGGLLLSLGANGTGAFDAFANTYAKGTKDTIDNLGNGTITTILVNSLGLF